MALEQQFPRLAAVSDIPRLISRENVSTTWPPPGTVEVRSAFPEPWVSIQGEPSQGGDGDWYVTTLGHIAGVMNETVEVVLARLGAIFTGPVAVFAATASQWPVIYEVGRFNHMRWIASTIRGTLGGVEQFQFGLNWGNPGSDPDPNEAEAAAFAEELAVQLAASLITTFSGATAMDGLTSEVKFVEVGATVKTQTEGTSADGTGGNLEQKFDTQWHAYGIGSQPTGASLSKNLPYEVSMALTLQTDKRGPSGRGRIYLPPFAVDRMSTLGKFNPALVNAWGLAIGDLFENMTTATGHVPVIVSRRRIVLNEVKNILVGYVPDSQRRRRRSQDEARTVQWTRP